MVHLLKWINDLANNTQFKLCVGAVYAHHCGVIGPVGKRKERSYYGVVRYLYQLALNFVA